MAHTHKCCQKQKLRRGLWSPDEDEKLLAYITKHGPGSWSSVPTLAGIQRCGKSCRLRWINYLRPDLKRGCFSAAEEKRITELHAVFGNKWSKIASHLPGRTDNEIKNMWNSCLKKRRSAQCKKPTSNADNCSENAAELKKFESLMKHCQFSRASSSCTPWPIFPFSQEDYVNTEHSYSPNQALINKDHLLISGNTLQQISSNPDLISIDQQIHINNNVLKQESHQEFIDIDQLVTNRQESDQVVINNDQIMVSNLQHMMGSIRSTHCQEIKVLQVQKSAINQAACCKPADYLVYITPPEPNQFTEREHLPSWNNYVFPNKSGFNPLTENQPFPAAHYSIINYDNSLENQHQSELLFAGLHELCQLGSINQSASTTCSDDSSASIPSLLDYQDVQFWFEEPSYESFSHTKGDLI